ncbi:hypothetical protein BBJ28_00019359 [Nothophytophthora sp. Chile5]|nr:hypothetical protein BBJ28_00019359 [Nothophytophthora sp. Chile5]
MTGRTDLRRREAEEVSPLLALATRPPSPISHKKQQLRRAEEQEKAAADPLPPRSQYAAFGSADIESHKHIPAVYGTMIAKPVGSTTSAGKKKVTGSVSSRASEADALLGDQQSNQSETESDSDGSCGGSASSSSLQSILRIRTGEYSCRSLKKQASVEFALDIDTDDEDEQGAARKKAERSCASRCVPRRLTIEEKAALYQVRPDLELMPTALLISELEELRRQRQRKLLFSILGAALILLMLIVFYYLVSQM